jgi:hypothetical protein
LPQGNVSPRTFALIPLGVVLALGVASCAPASPPCPAGTAPDAPRARALIALLERVREGATLTRRLLTRTPQLCFGRVPVSAITPDGTVLLDTALNDTEASARLAHLLLHVIEGSPAPRPGVHDCPAAVHQALTAEASALSLELHVRRDLGVTAPALRYEFEQDFWRAPPDDRHALILSYLQAHPTGAPGIDALAEGYSRRCRGR